MRRPAGALCTVAALGALVVPLRTQARAQDAPERVIDVRGEAVTVPSHPVPFAVTPGAAYVLRTASNHFPRPLAVYRVPADGSAPEMVFDVRSPSTPLSLPTGAAAAPRDVHVFGDTVVFVQDDVLWRIDAAGPARRVHRFDASPRVVHAGSDHVYLTVPRAAGGHALWVTDGTPGATLRLLGADEDADALECSAFVAFDGALAFLVHPPGSAAGDGSWWTTDGTPAGTRATPERAFAPPGAVPTVLGRLPGALVASDWSETDGGRVWRTDGTPEGTRVLLSLPRLSPVGVAIEGTREGAALLFASEVPGRPQWLWRTDGTTTGTHRVGELEAPQFRAFDSGAVAFVLEGALGGSVVWRTDGTDAGTLPLLDLGTETTRIDHAARFDGGFVVRTASAAPGLFRVADSGGPAGRWLPPQTDLVPAPHVADFNVQYPSLLAATQGRVWFAASGPDAPTYSLAVTDGTVPGTYVVPLGASATGRLDDVAAASDALFVSLEDPLAGRRLVRAAAQVDDVAAENGLGHAVANGPLAAFGDGVLYIGPHVDTADDEVTARLWLAGAGGAVDLAHVAPGDSPAATDPVRVIGGRGYFRAVTAFGAQTWSTDGSILGTRALGIAEPAAFLPFGDDALVSTYELGGMALWRTSGRFGDARRLAGLREVRATEYVETPLGASFVGRSDDAGTEVWSTDGTPLGTRLDVDVRPGPASSHPFGLVARDGTVFFSAHPDDAGPRSYARTPGGQLVEITPTIAAEPRWIADTLVELPNGRLFLRPAAAGGPELWRTDGTASGTVLVHRFEQGDAVAPASRGLALGDGRAVFRGADGLRGTEPWITDGTPAGTYPLIDLAPGAAGSFPDDFARIGDDLWFTADPSGEGVPTEVWRVPLGWIEPAVSPAPPPAPLPLPDLVPVPSPAPRPLVVDDLKVRIDLTRIARDRLSFRFRLPVPEGGELEGQQFRVRLGDLDVTATLDHRGRAELADGDVLVKAKPVRTKGGPGGLRVTLRIRRANLLNALTRERLVVPFGARQIERPVLATVTRVGIDHANVAALRYRANARKGRGRLVE